MIDDLPSHLCHEHELLCKCANNFDINLLLHADDVNSIISHSSRVILENFGNFSIKTLKIGYIK
jgi:nucleoid DNA-binding protein